MYVERPRETQRGPERPSVDNGEEEVVSMLQATPFRRGCVLMTPHIVATLRSLGHLKCDQGASGLQKVRVTQLYPLEYVYSRAQKDRTKNSGVCARPYLGYNGFQGLSEASLECGYTPVGIIESS